MEIKKQKGEKYVDCRIVGLCLIIKSQHSNLYKVYLSTAKESHMVTQQQKRA